MAKCINRENIVISIGTYKDKQTGKDKNQYRTIGELVTMQGDDGSTYQFGNLWGPTGVMKFNIYAQENRRQAVQQAQAMPASQSGQNYEGQNQPAFDDDIPF